MALSVQQTAYYDLINDLTNLSFTSGQIYAEGESLKAVLEQSPKNYQPFFTFFSRLNEHSKACYRLLDTIGRTKDSVTFLHEQFVAPIASQIERCNDEVASPLFSRIVQIENETTSRLFDILVQKLNDFRTNRQQTEHRQALNQLAIVHKKIFQFQSLPTRCKILFGQDEMAHLQKMNTLYRCLATQIDFVPQEGPGARVSKLHLACCQEIPSGEVTKKSKEERLHHCFDQLPKKFRVMIEKKGISPLSRFDDLDKLKQVLISSFREWKEKMMLKRKCCSEADFPEFYTILHKIARGPQGVDPVKWSQEELPYIEVLIMDALVEMSDKAEEPSQKVIVQEASSLSSSSSSSSSSGTDLEFSAEVLSDSQESF